MGSKPNGISGSRAAAVLGVSDYQTTVEVWLKIMEEQYPGFCAENNYAYPQTEYSASMKLGHHFEDSIIKKCCEIKGDTIHSQERVFSLRKTYLNCHVDGIYKNSGALHEGKTSNIMAWSKTYGKPGTDHVPAYIQAQVQHQMLCSGAADCIVSVLVFPIGQDAILLETELEKINQREWVNVLSQMGMFHQYPIARDWDLIMDMEGHYEEFWQKNVIEKTPPDPETYNDLKILFPEPRGTVVLSPELEEMSSEYKQINKELGSLDKRKEQIRNELLKYAVLHNGEIVEDGTKERIELMNRKGKKLHSWNGRSFR